MERGAGILMPISALPCKYGIGSLGASAFNFIDFLAEAGQRYWQVLPLMQTGYGDSPYQSCADGSGNPYFIDLEILYREGLLTRREIEGEIEKSPSINYGLLYERRYAILRRAFSRFDCSSPSFMRWLKKGKFADYACFMALKGVYGGAFWDFPAEYKYRDEAALRSFKKANEREILFWQFVQYKFFEQWKAVKKYAHKKGVKIIGDLPLYVACDSVDVWVNPSLFMLDSELKPEKVAGVPPDYFCEDGQLWGNPVYNYTVQAEDGYAWWKNRINDALLTFDVVRIDHFRGLDRFWAVDAFRTNARIGEWLSAPGEEILRGIDRDRIIAEDLGTIDDGVVQLIKKTGLANMKVLSFAFGGDFKNPYLPWNVKENCVYYTGTHDNDTVVGLLENSDEEFKKIIQKQTEECLDYLEIYQKPTGKYSLCDAFINIVYASRANMVIVPMHDVLGFDSSFRINTPATTGNWTVRYRKRLFTKTAAELLARKVRRFER